MGAGGGPFASVALTADLTVEGGVNDGLDADGVCGRGALGGALLIGVDGGASGADFDSGSLTVGGLAATASRSRLISSAVLTITPSGKTGA